jgi:uncharacterized protein (TIGR02678 family)
MMIDEDQTEIVAVSRATSLSLHAYTQNLIQAHTALLDHEIVSVHEHTEAFRWVRLHFAALEQWHEGYTGWRIQRNSSFFRLERHIHALTPVFVNERLKRPRDFACLVWLLWFAEKRYLAGGGRSQQFLLSQLAQELQEQTSIAGGPEKRLDFRNQQDRFSMGRALDYLIHLGAIQSLEGETRKWVDDADQPDNEVLYEFTAVTHSLVEALHEKQIAAIAACFSESAELLQPGYLAALADPIPPLNRIWRSLLLGPALLRYDDPVAFTALVHHADAVSEELAEAFGWQLELNSDYACIVRGGSLSSGSGPTLTLTSAHDQMILLLCSAFRQQVENGIWSPDSYGCLHVTSGDIEQLFAALRQRYGTYWGATVQTVKATELLDEIYQRMRLLSLLRGPDIVGDILVLPTAARYAVCYTEEPTGRAQRSRARTNTRSKK